MLAKSRMKAKSHVRSCSNNPNWLVFWGADFAVLSRGVFSELIFESPFSWSTGVSGMGKSGDELISRVSLDSIGLSSPIAPLNRQSDILRR